MKIFFEMKEKLNHSNYSSTTVVFKLFFSQLIEKKSGTKFFAGNKNCSIFEKIIDQMVTVVRRIVQKRQQKINDSFRIIPNYSDII